MKKLFFVTVIFFLTTIGAVAQKESDQQSYNKKRMDSLFRSLPGFLQTKAPANFEFANPGAFIASRTANGLVYNMALDNMAVFVPNMKQAEQMPGSNQSFKIVAPSAMPNPLYPQKNPAK